MLPEYSEYLTDLYKKRDYTVGKNSFVLGLEVTSGREKIIKKGDRKTILDLHGSGSLRHIWSTDSFKNGTSARLEFYIDGEKKPSITGKLADLVVAAQKCEQDILPLGGSVVNDGSYNLYLPVPFGKSLRLDLVLIEECEHIFLQLDYRLDDNSFSDTVIKQSGSGESLALSYSTDRREPRPVQDTEKKEFVFKGDGSAILNGPGVIKRLSLNTKRKGVKLKVYFDHSDSAALDADTFYLFGPFKTTAINNNQIFFPMPFKHQAKIEIQGSSANDIWHIETDVHHPDELESDFRYLHAKSVEAQSPSNGYKPFEILSTKGSGHFVAMAVYDSGMDHGGGDFAIIDAYKPSPHFLHGINGEDYFSFAFFGKGDNSPYSQAFDNEVGRFRLHLENPLTFTDSINLSWGTLKGLNPAAVSFWYQDSAQDRTISSNMQRGLKWQVFGPVDAPVTGDGNTPDNSSVQVLFSTLPKPEQLDKGNTFMINHRVFGNHTADFKGWATQHAVGSFLNLMYIYGHVMDLHGSQHMGYYPRSMMAKTELVSDINRKVSIQFSYDDPVAVYLNNELIFSDLALREGFNTVVFDSNMNAGKNTFLVKLLDTPNINTMWAGFNILFYDEKGNEISQKLQ